MRLPCTVALLFAFGCANSAPPPVSPAEATVRVHKNVAHNIAGQWQGIAKFGPFYRFRMILHITGGGPNDWTGTLHSLQAFLDKHDTVEHSSDARYDAMIHLDGSKIRMTIPQLKLIYEGEVSEDGIQVRGFFSKEGGGYVLPSPIPEDFGSKKAQFDLERPSPANTWPIDVAEPKASLVCVEHCASADEVKLELLDWGGHGRPLILLSGGGDTAHSFYRFGPNLVALGYHVYGITRRGYGKSSAPEPDGYGPNNNHSDNRRGDDIIAVVNHLHLTEPPVLVGHSRAGGELSNVGSRYPHAVAGLIYLDAGFYFAFDDGMPTPPLPVPTGNEELATKESRILKAEHLGEQKYRVIPPPILNIYAFINPDDPIFAHNGADELRLARGWDADTRERADRFERAFPRADVVRLANSTHYLCHSNEAEVLRLVDEFIKQLPLAK